MTGPWDMFDFYLIKIGSRMIWKQLIDRLIDQYDHEIRFGILLRSEKRRSHKYSLSVR